MKNIFKLESGHIYITSDEEIKEGDCVYCITENRLLISNVSYSKLENRFKIILTTDKELIKDGVQSIDDTFLEWFVKNPSCERVEVENEKAHIGWESDYTYEYLGIDGSKNVYQNFYKIIIPKEKPKQ
jgi:hypothetical protein